MNGELIVLLAAAGGAAGLIVGIFAVFYRFYVGDWPLPRNGKALNNRIEQIEKRGDRLEKRVHHIAIGVAKIEGWIEGRINQTPDDWNKLH